MGEPSVESQGEEGKPDFDPDLSRKNEKNREAARVRGLTWSPRRQAYVDEDGCPVRDRFGQRL